MPTKSAHTLAELALTLALLAVATAIAIPSTVSAQRRWRLRGAADDVLAALVYGREAARARSVPTVVVVDATLGEVRVTAGAELILRRALGSVHGVALRATADTVRFGPDGLATGVSNTTILLTLGGRVDSVVVSRLGRVRWAGGR